MVFSKYVQWRMLAGHVIWKPILLFSSLCHPSLIPILTVVGSSPRSFPPASILLSPDNRISFFISLLEPMTKTVGTVVGGAGVLETKGNDEELQVRGELDIGNRKGKSQGLQHCRQIVMVFRNQIYHTKQKDTLLSSWLDCVPVLIWSSIQIKDSQGNDQFS